MNCKIRFPHFYFFSLFLLLLNILDLPKAIANDITDLLDHLNKQNVIAGELWDRKSHKQKEGTVVVFLSTNCPCSGAHLQELRNLKDKFVNFEFLGVHANRDETLEEGKKYFAVANLPFPVIRDGDRQFLKNFNGYRTPHAFVVSRKGEILYKGGVTNSATPAEASEHYLQAALENLSQGKAVSKAEGRTTGCVISR